MALVAYSDSDSEEFETDLPPPYKKVRTYSQEPTSDDALLENLPHPSRLLVRDVALVQDISQSDNLPHPTLLLMKNHTHLEYQHYIPPLQPQSCNLSHEQDHLEQLPHPSLLINHSDLPEDQAHSKRLPLTSQLIKKSDPLRDRTQLDRLPLPPQLLTKKSDPLGDKGHQDNPEDHDGRQRSFEHKRGNWATFVYLPYNDSEGALSQLQTYLQSLLGSDHGLAMKVVDQPHVSLSKTSVLYHHWIEGFIQQMQALVNTAKTVSVHFDDCDFLVNDEKTRSFFALRISSNCHDNMHTLSSVVDECFNKFKGASYYKSPTFHMSILWMLGDINSILSLNQQKSICLSLMSMVVEQFESILTTEIDEIQTKIGHKIYRFGLST